MTCQPPLAAQLESRHSANVNIAFRMLAARSARRAHATPLEKDVARSHEGAEVDHLGHDIGELLLGRDEHDLSPAMSDEPSQVVLPA